MLLKRSEFTILGRNGSMLTPFSDTLNSFCTGTYNAGSGLIAPHVPKIDRRKK
jgi:hypothetical protein